MAEAQRDKQAEQLAAKALELVAAGRDEDGSRALREAVSLAPDNAEVKAAFDKIQKDDLQHLLHQLCSRFALENDKAAGKEAVHYLSRSAEVPPDVAEKCLDLVLEHGDQTPSKDDIVTGLLRESPAAKRYLAKMLYDCKDNSAFEKIYNIGEGAANGISTVVLDASSWSSQADQDHCKIEVFQYFLAKLLEVGHEHDGKALKGIARLLATDAEKLEECVDDDCFDAVLSCLDERNPVNVRSQATLATAKIVEASGERGQKALTSFITTRVNRQKNEDLVLAFSAAAGVFPVAPSIMSALFLTEGFLEGLIPLVEKKAKSEKVETATLNMLNAACIDSACRGAIQKHCASWLQNMLKKGEEEGSEAKMGTAAVILTKLQGPSTQNENTKSNGQNTEELVRRLKGMMDDGNPEAKQSSIEGLAYASVKPKVKEELARDGSFLRSFQGMLGSSQPGSSVAFGGLTLIDNLTRYLPNLSEEQKRMSQLKAYANAAKPSQQIDPLEEDAAVTERCKAVVKAGTISTLVGISRSLSSGSIGIVFNILLSLSKTASLRGTIAQQGGLRLLLQSYTLVTGTSDAEVQSRYDAAHALARILTSVDPSLVFTGSLSLNSAIRPLISLLGDNPRSSTGPRDLLPTFEALLALTNLASVRSSNVSETIIRLAFPTIEELMLSNNERVRSASTQLVCNLVNCDAGMALFGDGSKAAERRVHILLAMADVDHLQTREAAAGALAMITSTEGVITAILARDRGVEILLGLIDGEETEGVVHRGVVCIMQVINADKEANRKQAIQKILELHGHDMLAAVINKFPNNKEVSQLVFEALKLLARGR
ncbi:protein unc-45, partial [Lecanoromycetidae sp. Uapishka_2]